jgi:hypothetical protein
MTWEHDRVEELLAARSLQGLDPEEAALAERALLEHVPECPRCREALDAFGLLSGDLSLLTDPVAPPRPLEVRLRRSIRRRRPARGMRWTAVAAAVVVAGGLAGWNLNLASRLDDAEAIQRWATEAIISSGHPRGSVVPLRGPGEERAIMVYVQGEETLYVMATRLEEPQGVYKLWFFEGERAWSPGAMELRDGIAFLLARTDPHRWDFVMITEETGEDTPAPTSSPLVSATVE